MRSPSALKPYFFKIHQRNPLERNPKFLGCNWTTLNRGKEASMKTQKLKGEPVRERREESPVEDGRGCQLWELIEKMRGGEFSVFFFFFCHSIPLLANQPALSSCAAGFLHLLGSLLTWEDKAQGTSELAMPTQLWGAD
ncbi:hypothetical protein COLO4_11818 [Corchorus olitorius]|uniref:Uncharacterized protein n=1 Tax=Corchorus olitorius TaxID=93759 RepID=A0A1R3K328_9ROSI|nr:hypothetical protein COLO4_11818 [Corchorus olitorius]